MRWVRAAAMADFADRDVIAVTCEGQAVALYRIGDTYFASRDRCPHQGTPLSGGCVVDGFIECPAHYALFDIRTGAADGSVTAVALKTLATRQRGTEIDVDLDA